MNFRYQLASNCDKDELIHVLLLDHLTWNENLAGFVKQVMAPPVEAVKGSRAFRLNGTTTQTAAAGLETLGWSIKTGISLESTMTHKFAKHRVLTRLQASLVVTDGLRVA